MALGSALAFLIKVRDDKALQTQLRTLKATDFNGLLKSATGLGFGAFTQTEFYEAAGKIGGEWQRWAALMRGETPTIELSESDLEKVAGGKAGPAPSACETSMIVNVSNACL